MLENILGKLYTLDILKGNTQKVTKYFLKRHSYASSQNIQ